MRRLIQCFGFGRSKNIPLLCAHTLSFEGPMLIETNPFGIGRYQWRDIHEVTQDLDRIYIFITPQLAHIVPKRIFPDSQTASQFYERARALHAESRAVASNE